MIPAILEIIAAALQIWEYKEKRKYIDQLLSLKQTWYEEINKPLGERDNALLDNTEWAIKNLATTISLDIKSQDVKPTT
jgi:seryl-tRNA(Sec) selenium transferase